MAKKRATPARCVPANKNKKGGPSGRLKRVMALYRLHLNSGAGYSGNIKKQRGEKKKKKMVGGIKSAAFNGTRPFFFLFLFSLSLSFVSLFLSLHSLRRVSHRVTLQKNLSLIRGYVYIHVQRNKKKREDRRWIVPTRGRMARGEIYSER